jgi:Integrase core domain
MTQGRRRSVAEKRQILIELRKGSSIRKVSRALHVHRDIVRSVIDVANIRGWLHPDCLIPSEEEMQCIIEQKHQPTHILDGYRDNIQEWCQEGYSGVVIQRLLQKNHDVFVHIGALRRYLKKHFPEAIDPVMIRRTIPGVTMDVDFGFLGMLWDEKSQKMRKAWVFSARLRHSRKAYRRIVPKQDSQTFLMCHIHAFEHFNGVPEEVVLDNLKAGVIQSSIDNNILNRSYYELAEHYNFRISPCLPRTPEHKGGVENDIKFIKRNFWPEIREKIKQQSRFSFNLAQEAIEKWDNEIANIRIIRGINRSPQEIFTYEEKDSLKPLPLSRWECVKWLQCTVGRDWRVVIDSSYYSVPYAYIGQTVHCKVTSQFVHIYHEYENIAKHPIANSKGEYIKNSDHAPPFKDAVLSCTREGLLENAKEVGPNTYTFCQQMFSNPHIDKLRPVRSLLSLVIKYDKIRLENACKRALSYKNHLYSSVKNILERGLDFDVELNSNANGQPTENEQNLSDRNILSCTEKMCFKFARDPKEYGSQKVNSINPWR